jgi:hypothetical protein
MSTLQPWPVCPRPQPDESLPSWFERIGAEYQMMPNALLSSFDLSDGPVAPMAPRLARDTAERLQAPRIRSKIAALSRLPDTVCNTLWPSTTGWELIDGAFRSYCPHCCLGDLREQRTPYGRRGWLQSWCTLCQFHGTALVLRNPHHRRASMEWSAQTLCAETHYLAPDRYRTLKVARESNLRSLILGSLVDIERAISNALAGLSPNPLSWGLLTLTEFLRIVTDLTTWSLTHFEPVRAWSLAEDLSPAEEQEGYGLIGRRRRMSTADYPPRRSLRTLREINEPKIRGSALWVAHAVMSASHVGASDRDATSSLQERQASYLRRAAPAARAWLANQQRQWPAEYRRRWWITDPSLDDSRYDPHSSVKH